MTSQLRPDRLEAVAFTDFKPALNDAEAHAEANRCINCYEAPCINACPTRIDIPRFISRIANGNAQGAARTILEANVLGLSCAQSCPTEVLCEGACVYNTLDHKPITIGKLQRHAVEKAYDSGKALFEAGAPTGKRVALVGAGPASLACAHELRLLGHETVIFEKSPLPGGLNTQGIAPYKMKAAVSLREIEQLTRVGVEIRTGKELGRDVTLGGLTAEFDAVFLGLGLGPDSRLEVPGVDLPLVRGAVDFIAHLKTDAEAELAWVRKLPAALVVGGGNTALDACRELKKLGIPRVAVSYRRGEADMSGYQHELRWARQEGVDFLFHTVPSRFEARGEKSGAGVRVELLSTAGGAPSSFEAGLVLLAIGQSKLESLLSATSGLGFEKGRLKTDADGRTGHPKIFAGGDLANGGMEVVNAVAEGKRAARAIHAGLGVRHG